jgi:hypothetical protein
MFLRADVGARRHPKGVQRESAAYPQKRATRRTEKKGFTPSILRQEVGYEGST